jgi:hypothetical protein
MEHLAIVILAKNHNPTILNPDFLKYNKIVPEDWSLASAPICAEVVSEVIYTNGVQVTAQFDKLVFRQLYEDNASAHLLVPDIAAQYVHTIRHVDYRAIGINPKGYVITDSQEKASQFVLQKCIAPGPWKEFPSEPQSASVKFVYPCTNGIISVFVEDASLTLSERESKPVVSFNANVHRDLSAFGEDRLERMIEILHATQQDVDMFRELVARNFLYEGGR